MTEIALALAMAFFSIMILTMVSMGAGAGDAKSTDSRTDTAIRALPVQVVQSAPDQAEQARVSKQDKIIIFYRGAFYDSSLQAADPGAIKSQPPARIVLAISPDLPMSQALDARARFSSRDVIVTTLNIEWITRLKEISR